MVRRRWDDKKGNALWKLFTVRVTVMRKTVHLLNCGQQCVVLLCTLSCYTKRTKQNDGWISVENMSSASTTRQTFGTVKQWRWSVQPVNFNILSRALFHYIVVAPYSSGAVLCFQNVKTFQTNLFDTVQHFLLTSCDFRPTCLLPIDISAICTS